MDAVKVLLGFIGVCQCGFQTDDVPTKALVRYFMQQHFVAVFGERALQESFDPHTQGHCWERIG